MANISLSAQLHLPTYVDGSVIIKAVSEVAGKKFVEGETPGKRFHWIGQVSDRIEEHLLVTGIDTAVGILPTASYDRLIIQCKQWPESCVSISSGWEEKAIKVLRDFTGKLEKRIEDLHFR